MVEYKVVRNTDYEAFLLLMGNSCNNGWLPTGGVVIYPNEYGADLFLQSMTRVKDEKTTN